MSTSREYLDEGLGYGLSRNSQLKLLRIQERRQVEAQAIEKVRRLIDWAHTSLELAKSRSEKNIKLYADLTLNWTPERVLTTYRYFERMCTFIKEENVWRMLDRKERRFIADAYTLYIQLKQSGSRH